MLTDRRLINQIDEHLSGPFTVPLDAPSLAVSPTPPASCAFRTHKF